MTGAQSLWQVLFQMGGIPLLIALLPLYLFALAKSDPTGRACTHVLAFGVGLFALFALDQRSNPFDWAYSAGQLVADILLLTALSAISVHSSRQYPIIMAAAQLLIVLAGSLAVAGLIAPGNALAAIIGAAAGIQLAAYAVGLVRPGTNRRAGAATVVFAD